MSTSAWPWPAVGAEPKPVDYSQLSGFTQPSVRIDPHSHEARPVGELDLLKIAELLRQPQTKPPGSLPAKVGK